MRRNLSPLQRPMLIHCQSLSGVRWQMPFGELLADRSKIHIWKSDLRKYSKSRLASYLGLLSKKELLRIQYFPSEEDRKRFIVMKAILRKLLARYQGLVPEAVSFSRNFYNKPFLHPNPAGTQFNVSHSGHKLLLAFRFAARGTSLGIDLEKIDTNYDYIPLLKDYFTDAEKSSLIFESSSERFFEYWTRKEAILKAVGTGLTQDMRLINVSNFTNIVKFENAVYSRMTHQPFYVNSFKIDQNYVASIALEGKSVQPLFIDYDFIL